MSALKIAFGLGGKVALIDTENGSGELYSNLGEYDTATLLPPYEPERYQELMTAAESEDYKVIILDSISHAWAGEGGLLDQHDKYAKNAKSSYTAWREVTPKHNAFIEAMLRSPAHIIATMRSKVAYVLEENDKGKQVPRKIGMAPIQREGMDYEFTLVLDLNLEHHATASKDRTSLFDGRAPFIPTENTGVELIDWLETGADPAEESALTMQVLISELDELEQSGTGATVLKWARDNKDAINALLPKDKDRLEDRWRELRAKFNGENQAE